MEQSMESLISIVLPIYNGEKYMRKSIDSVLAQTYANWELLIIDDRHAKPINRHLQMPSRTEVEYS